MQRRPWDERSLHDPDGAACLSVISQLDYRNGAFKQLPAVDIIPNCKDRPPWLMSTGTCLGCEMRGLMQVCVRVCVCVCVRTHRVWAFTVAFFNAFNSSGVRARALEAIHSSVWHEACLFSLDIRTPHVCVCTCVCICVYTCSCIGPGVFSSRHTHTDRHARCSSTDCVCFTGATLYCP